MRIRELIEFCREHGVLRLRTEEIELELAPHTPAADMERLERSVRADGPSPEEMLFWSAPQAIESPPEEKKGD